MSELRKLLEGIEDTYSDFVNGIMASVKENEAFEEKFVKFIRENPAVTTSQVIEYLDKLEGLI